MRLGRSALAIAASLQLLIASCAPTRPSALLGQTWEGYKHDFILADGRVIDYGRDRQTTSEGQSYAMLRAVWMADRPAFDRVWRWTQVHLQVRGDRLFGYLWGPDDSQGNLLDRSAAADADEDIALALVFAGHRWHENA